MKKFNFKKTLLSLFLGAIMMFGALPVTFGALSANASELKDPYKTPTTVDIAGSFDNNKTSSPEKWTLSTEYGNDKDSDSTSFNGVISSELSGWDKAYTDQLDAFIAEWDKNHNFTYGDTDRAKIETALKADILKHNSPLVPNYELNKTTDFKILALEAGTTYTQYLDPADENNVLLHKEDRLAYNKYTSNEFSLDSYSFYKITVWVKTTNNGNASISLNGEIDETVFEGIDTSASKNNIPYYFYTFTDGTNSTTFVSIVAPGTSVEYNNITYNFDANENKYLPDNTDPDYIPSDMANYSVTATGKTETASFADWKQYTIYVSTTTETKVSLELALGSEASKSAGNAYFDNAKVEKIQLLDYYFNAVQGSTVAVFDNREILDQNNLNSRNYNVVQNFETSHDFTILNAPLEDTDLVIVEESATTKIKETFPNANPSNTNKMLKINNHGSKEVTVVSGKIQVEKMRYYRISFWAQSVQSNATLKVTLASTKADGSSASAEDSTKPYIDNRNEKDLTDINNLWVQYVFYIQASSEKSSEAEIKFTIPAGICIYVDNMVIENVTKQEYTDSKNSKLDLSTNVSDEILTNGSFYSYDSVDVTDYSNPLPPTGWTSTKTADIYEYFNSATSDKFTTAYLEEDLTFNAEKTTITLDGKNFVKADDNKTFNYKDGDKVVEKIVLVKDKTFKYNSSKGVYDIDGYDVEITSFIKAGIDISSNKNVLSITATGNEGFTYKSSVMKLSATSSLYIISAQVYTDIATTANMRLVDKDGKVYSSINHINTFNQDKTESEWKTFKFYVSTGLETIELFLELEFEENVGVVNFKNLNALKTTSTTVLAEKLAKTNDELLREGIAVIDLSGESFIEHAGTINNSTHLFDTNLYKDVEISGKTSGIYGVLDTTNPHANFSSIEAKDAEVSPYVLVIKNNSGESTKLESVKKFTIAKEKYMTITIVARVEGLPAGKTALINFPSLNKTFEVTSTDFVEFKLYIDNKEGEESSSIGYEFALLDSEGTLIVDSIKIESPDDIDSAKDEYPNGDTDTVKFATVNVTDEEDEDDKKDETSADDLEIEEENNTLEIFMAVLSSLLLVAAIIFALVYTRVKALHKPRKKSQKNKVSETDDGQKGFV